MARPLTRLVVLPFRVLRADPETDFLAFSLPDAIATSLSGIGSLILRSSAVAGALRRRRSGSQGARGRCRRRSRRARHAPARGRSAARLGAARRGAGRHVAHIAHGAVVDGRPFSPAGRHRQTRGRGALGAAGRRSASPTPDSPHDARAYELYLRANELARTYDGLLAARATCTSAASSWIRGSLPRGPAWAAAIA